MTSGPTDRVLPNTEPTAKVNGHAWVEDYRRMQIPRAEFAKPYSPINGIIPDHDDIFNHEIGHLLGIPHPPAGIEGRSIMDRGAYGVTEGNIDAIISNDWDNSVTFCSDIATASGCSGNDEER